MLIKLWLPTALYLYYNIWGTVKVIWSICLFFFPLGEAFLTRGIKKDAQPHLTSEHPAKKRRVSIWSPETQQTYASAIHDIRSSEVSSFDLWGMERKKGEEGKGFPALLKGDDPIFHPSFQGNYHFLSVRDRRSPKNVWEIPQILTCSSNCGRHFPLFCSLHRAHERFHSNFITHNYDPKAREISWRYLLTEYWRKLAHMWPPHVMRINDFQTCKVKWLLLQILLR